MAWADEGLWFSFILNGAAMAILIPIAFMLHTNKRFLNIARLFRPNHTLEPKSLRPLTAAEQARLDRKAAKGASAEALAAAGASRSGSAAPSSVDDNNNNNNNTAGNNNFKKPNANAPDTPSDRESSVDPTPRHNNDEDATEEDEAGFKDLAADASTPLSPEETDTVMGRLLLRYGSSLFAIPPLRRLLSVGEGNWERDDDDTPLKRDPAADLFLAFLKTCLIIFFIVASLSTTWLALICPYDDYNYQSEMESDPIKCREKGDEDSCHDHKPVCHWIGGSRCEPNPQGGLADLSIQNLQMRSTKFWAVGIFACVFAVLTLLVFYFMLNSITAFHRRVLQRQLRNAVGYRAVVVKGLKCPSKNTMKKQLIDIESTIQIRDPNSVPTDADACYATTVTSTIKAAPDYIAGYPGSDVDYFYREFLSAEAFFGPSAEKEAEEERLRKERIARGESLSPEQEAEEKKKEKAKAKKKSAIRVGGFLCFGGKKLSPDELSLFRGRDPITGISSKVEDIVIERQAHKKFHKAYVEYEAAKLAYQDAVASEQQYHHELARTREICYARLDEMNAEHQQKQQGEGAAGASESSQRGLPPLLVEFERETLMPPLLGRVIPSLKCCYKVPIVAYRKNDLLKKGEKLNRAIEKNRSTPFCGSVFVVFKDSLSAFEFVDLFNRHYGGLTSAATAQIAGPYELIEQINLPINKFVSYFLGFFMACAFAALCLFWSIPIAFLGSLDSLATVPGIGKPFQSFINELPTVIVGILTAYLPVIVLAVFNIVLPILIRFMVRTSGSLTIMETDNGVLFRMYLFLVLTGVVFQAALQGGVAQIGSIITSPDQDTVFNFVTSIISPKGGYWFAMIISAGCLSMWLGAVLIGPFIMMMLLSKRASNQRGYNAFFQRQVPDWPLRYAFTLIPTTIGFFFHATVPLIGIFVGIYFLNQYVIYRGIYLDNHCPLVHPDRLVSNFRLAATTFRAMAVTYLISAVGLCIVVGLREHTGGLVLCIIAAAIALLTLLRIFSESHKWKSTLNNTRDVLDATDGTITVERESDQQCAVGNAANNTKNNNNVLAVPIPTSDEEDEMTVQGSDSDGGVSIRSNEPADGPRSGKKNKKKKNAAAGSGFAAVGHRSGSAASADGNLGLSLSLSNSFSSHGPTAAEIEKEEERRFPKSTPEAPYGPLTNPKLDDTDDTSRAARLVSQRRPFRSIHHTLNATTIDMEEDMRRIEEREYNVIMLWHGEENRRAIEKEKEKELEKEAGKLEKAIIKGKHKPFVPSAAAVAKMESSGNASVMHRSGNRAAASRRSNSRGSNDGGRAAAAGSFAGAAPPPAAVPIDPEEDESL